MNYTTSTAVKAMLGNMVGTSDDPLINSLISAYSAQVDQYLNQSFALQTNTLKVLRALIDLDGNLTCYPPTPVVSSVTVLNWRDNATLTWNTAPISQVDIWNKADGAIVRLVGTNFAPYRSQNRRLQVQLSYACGYTDSTQIPVDVEMSVRQLVCWAYQLKNAPITETANADFGVTKPARSWPAYVTDNLRNYRRLYTS